MQRSFLSPNDTKVVSFAKGYKSRFYTILWRALASHTRAVSLSESFEDNRRHIAVSTPGPAAGCYDAAAMPTLCKPIILGSPGRVPWRSLP